MEYDDDGDEFDYVLYLRRVPDDDPSVRILSQRTTAKVRDTDG